MERIHTKLDRIEDRLDKIEVTLAVNTQSLQEHMKRTQILEEQVIPLKRANDMWNGAYKLIIVLGTVLGLLVGAAKLLGLL